MGVPPLPVVVRMRHVTAARARWRAALLDHRPVRATLVLLELDVCRRPSQPNKVAAVTGFVVDARHMRMPEAADDAMSLFPPSWRAGAHDLVTVATALDRERAAVQLAGLRAKVRTTPGDPSAHLAVADTAFWAGWFREALESAGAGRRLAGRRDASAEVVAGLDRVYDHSLLALELGAESPERLASPETPTDAT